jgi:hypothetical protein
MPKCTKNVPKASRNQTAARALIHNAHRIPEWKLVNKTPWGAGVKLALRPFHK